MLRDRRLTCTALALERGRRDFANYRPVSLMSILTEILEWIIKRMVCEPLTKRSGGLRN